MTGPRDWRKSSYSSQTNTCVEVANTLSEMRDSKNPNGPSLPGNISALVAAVKDGQLG